MKTTSKHIIVTLLLLSLLPALLALESTLTLQGGVAIPIDDWEGAENVLHGDWGISWDAWIKDNLAVGINPYFNKLQVRDLPAYYSAPIEGLDLYLKVRPSKFLNARFSDDAVINRIAPFVAFGAGYAHHSSQGSLGAGVIKDKDYMVVLPFASAGVSLLTKWNTTLDLGVKYHYSNTDQIDVNSAKDWNDSWLTPFVGLGIHFGAKKDSDGDGIPDKKDKAPYDAEDFDGFQDNDGIPDPDNDNDGILDVYDKAPNDPEDFDGFQDNDGIPDPDNDNDGILDIYDKAPNDPEDFDGFQDNDGIPDPDNDNDGIPDIRDMAPGTDETVRNGIDTRETYNDYEDEDGVPDVKPETPKPEEPKPEQPKPEEPKPEQPKPEEPKPEAALDMEKDLVLHVVHFETNYYKISAADKLLLDAVAAGLKKFPNVRLQVQGHTDSTGPLDFNTRLAVNRAQVVKDYLVSKGIAASRLEVKGFGPDKPVDTNDTVEGRAANRRTDFIILK